MIDWDLYEGGTATWRPEDYGDGAVHISYAYLAANGSNENIITFSKAAFVGEQMVGIVASMRAERTTSAGIPGFGQDTIYHQVKGANHFVRMGEHFADSVLNGTPLRYDLTDAANNARVLEGLDAATWKGASESRTR